MECECVPLILKKWEPDVLLDRVEPRRVPLWIMIHDLPLNLWNGGSLGQIVSLIGKPIMMDKMTKERCIKKRYIAGFARILVEADVGNDLPTTVKVKYPAWNGN